MRALTLTLAALSLACSEPPPESQGSSGFTSSNGGGSTGGDGSSGSAGSSDGESGGSTTTGDGDVTGASGTGATSGGPSPADWDVEDQLGEEGTLGWTNGELDFLLRQVQGGGAPWPDESRLWLDITHATRGYKVTVLLSRFHGLFDLGGQQFLVHPGVVTDHGVEQLGDGLLVIWLEYASPYDDFFQGGGPQGRPSALLGTQRIELTAHWEDGRLDLDLERPILVNTANHNGFFTASVRPDGFPFTMRMGVSTDAANFASVETSERHPEDPFGYVLREDGNLGRYDDYNTVGSVPWNDYYVIERSRAATVVYMPEFRDIAVKTTYGGGFYGNWITPRAAGVTVAMAQTGVGASYSFLDVPAGDYAERISLLLDVEPQPDLSGYDALVEQLP